MGTINIRALLLPLGLLMLFVLAVVVIYLLLQRSAAAERVEQMLEEVVEENRTEMGELLEEFQSSLRNEPPPSVSHDAVPTEAAQPKPPAETP